MSRGHDDPALGGAKSRAHMKADRDVAEWISELNLFWAGSRKSFSPQTLDPRKCMLHLAGEHGQC